MANNITTASALFETFQNIMQGRKVAAREQNRAVQAMILQGMLNEVLNQRQLLRREQSQLNAIEVQKKYDIMQTLISKKADLTKERMKIEAEEKEAREKVAFTKLDPITGKLHQFNEYGQEISAAQLTPKPAEEGKEYDPSRDYDIQFFEDEYKYNLRLISDPLKYNLTKEGVEDLKSRNKEILSIINQIRKEKGDQPWEPPPDPTTTIINEIISNLNAGVPDIEIINYWRDRLIVEGKYREVDAYKTAAELVGSAKMQIEQTKRIDETPPAYIPEGYIWDPERKTFVPKPPQKLREPVSTFLSDLPFGSKY